MKKIISTLAIMVIAVTGAKAQDNANCQSNKGIVCKGSPGNNNARCYQTKFAANFKVCKSDESGYYICCEQPDRHNSTEPAPVALKPAAQPAGWARATGPDEPAQRYTALPQSQSFVNYTGILQEQAIPEYHEVAPARIARNEHR